MRIGPADLRVEPEVEAELTRRPTIGEPICDAKKEYKKLLRAHVANLSLLQRLHYASHHLSLIHI